MSKIRIRIARRVVEIQTIYPLTNSMWRKFYTDLPYDFRVQTTLEDIEREASSVTSCKELGYHFNSKVETLAVHRKICEQIVDYNTFMIHGAALAVNGRGILFCGKSGIGKTTHLFKWLDNCDDANVISGDKPFIISNEVPILCGSPWGGKENMCNDVYVPLHTIVFLQRAENNQILQLSFSDAYLLLLQYVYRPIDYLHYAKTIKLLASLQNKVNFFKFKCNNFSEDSFIVSYNAIIGE